MKIYTKTGDAGETSLFTGDRVSKSNTLVDIFGQLDELNSLIGVLCNKTKETGIKEYLKGLQAEIFSLGSYFASSFTLSKYVESLEPLDLEVKMDEMDEKLEQLKNFILPGGCEAASFAHLCRTSARSVERAVVKLDKPKETQKAVVYLNRLSDYFFVLARYYNFLEKVEEPIWKPSK